MSSLSLAPIPRLIQNSTDKKTLEILSFLGGVLLLSLLAQITLRLPWTPVPITGQTFGVAVMSLVWGRKRALTVLGAYLLMGGLGAPIFAMGGSGFVFGPTMGYLLGMVIGGGIMGELADRGYTKNLGGSLMAAYAGSAIVFICGLSVLSFFIPSQQLLVSGLLPFLPGDLIKNLVAATIATRFKNR